MADDVSSDQKVHFFKKFIVQRWHLRWNPSLHPRRSNSGTIILYYNYFKGVQCQTSVQKRTEETRGCFCMESVHIAYSTDNVTKERCNCSPKAKFIKPFKVKVYHKYCLLSNNLVSFSSLVSSCNQVPDCGMVSLCLIPGQTNTQGIYITKKKIPPLL